MQDSAVQETAVQETAVQEGAVQDSAVQEGAVQESAGQDEPEDLQVQAAAGVDEVDKTAVPGEAVWIEDEAPAPVSEEVVERAWAGLLSSLLGAEDEDGALGLGRGARDGRPMPEAAETVEPAGATPPVEATEDSGQGQRVDLEDLALSSATGPQASLEAAVAPRGADDRRRELQTLLESAPSAQSAAEAASAISDPDLDVRHLAVQILERAPGLAPIDALYRAALDPNTPLRARALNLLGAAGGIEHVSFLASRACQEQDQVVCGAALSALADVLGRHGADAVAEDEISSVVGAFGALTEDCAGRYAREIRLVASVFGSASLIARVTHPDPKVSAGASVLFAAMPAQSEVVSSFAPVVERPDAPTPAGGPAPAEAVPSPSWPSPLSAASGSAAPGGYAGHPALGGYAAPVASGGGGSPAAEPVDAPAAPGINELALAGLAEALADPDSAIRQGASQALQAQPPRQVAAWLAGRLASGEPGAVDTAARVAACVNLDAAAFELGDFLLGATDATARGALASLMAPLPSTETVVAEWLDRPDTASRRAAIELASVSCGLGPAALAKALADPSVDVRLAAVGAVRPPLDLELARVLLGIVQSDSSPAVALAAAGVLGAAGDELRHEASQACLRQGRSDIRRAGVNLVPMDEEGSSVLLRLLYDTDLEVAAAAARALEAFPASEVVMTVWPALRVASGPSSELMIDLLGRVDRRMTERLARNSAESIDPVDRLVGLGVLIRLGGEALADRVLRALSDPSRDVRCLAVRSLKHHPGLVPVDAVGTRTHDPDVEVRRAVVEVLVSVDDESIVVHLLDAARDPVADIRDPARSFLRARCTGSSAEILVHALADPSVRGVAAELLAQSPHAAVEPIIRALPDADVDTRSAMGQVLAAPAAVEILVGGLSHPDPVRRLVSLRGLGLVGPAGSTRHLTACLEDPDPAIRREACHLLGRLGEASAAPALRQSLATDPDMQVVGAAEEALRRLSEVEPRAYDALAEGR